MFKIHYTTKFKKDYKTIYRRSYQLELLKEVIQRLAETGTLHKEFLPLKLSCQYKDNWECHIKPDWLLIWNIYDRANEIWLVRKGTYSDLFKSYPIFPTISLKSAHSGRFFPTSYRPQPQ